MRILIIKPSSLGDILHTLPSVGLLQHSLPDAEIHWVVNEEFAELLQLGNSPAYPPIKPIPFPRKTAANPFVFLKFIRQLRKTKYDLIIDYQGLFRSGLIAFCAKGKRRIGFADGREFSPLFYQNELKIFNSHSHAADKNLVLTQAALDWCHIEMASLAEVFMSDFSHDKRENQISVCFSSRWESKNWPLEIIAEILNQVLSKRPTLRCKLVGGAADIPNGEKICQLIQSEYRDQCLNLAGKTTLLQLAEQLRQSAAMLTVDSGPMHLAAAVGTPCVALFGATDPVLTGPWQNPAAPLPHCIIRSQCSQSPCFKRICPLHKSCSEGISPADIANQLLSLLPQE